jgi:hypothetical protein
VPFTVRATSGLSLAVLLTTPLDVAGAFASAVPAAVSVTVNAANKIARRVNSFRDIFPPLCPVWSDHTKLPPPMSDWMPESDIMQMKKVPTKPLHRN